MMELIANMWYAAGFGMYMVYLIGTAVIVCCSVWLWLRGQR